MASRDGFTPATWKSVYAIVRRVPKGTVMTYGALAKAAKLRGGAREAGHAMGACPRGLGIPWHRIVGAGGRLLIREPFASLQKRLLDHEGVGFVGRKVDMENHAWLSPSPQKRRKPKRRKQNKRARRKQK